MRHPRTMAIGHDRVMTTDPDLLRARLRADLTTAMKARDKDAVAVLRTALAAFDNAEAVAAPPSTPGPPATSEHVAGSSVGLGSAEVARRVLTLADLHDILRDQVDERTAEARTYAALGQVDAADRLRRDADLLRAYLPD
jgi:uncharacterized protein YqeY